jgi:dephospho-CoA kinase
MTFIVGLGGGIGSGKTAASDYFETLGVSVIDADLASRAVVEKGRPALQKISEHVGQAVLPAQGELDRAYLRAQVFSSNTTKAWLEALLHPLISEEIKRSLNAATSPYAILVSPLLVESGQYQRANRVLIIDAPEQLQVSRASARDNNTNEQVEAIMKAQADRANRLAVADDVILNDGSLTSLHRAADKLHEQYLALSEADSGG